MTDVTDRLRPLHNNVLIRMDPKREKIGLIHLPERAHQEVGTGTVVAVGPGWTDPKTGRLHEPDVQVGDRVAYEIFRAVEKVMEEAEADAPEGYDLGDSILYTIVQERHLLGVLEGEGEIEVRA